MRFIYIGFSKSKKFKIGSWLIQKWIKEDYSHVYIRYIDDQNRDIIFHASHGTVHQILQKNFIIDNINDRLYKLEVTEEQYQTFRNIYYEESGKLYSFKDLCMIPIHDLLFKFGIYLKNENDDGYICSELAGYALHEVFNINFNKPFNLLSPKDIEDYVKNIGNQNEKLDS